MIVSRRIVLHFPRRLVDRPIVCRLVKDYDLEFNILKASVTPEEEGLMVLELSGEQEAYDKGIRYLITTGVRIQSLSQNVTRNEERCTHCGACLTICPTAAFELEPSTRRVKFYDEKCLACALCIKACPPRAMEVHF
ncbi:4Fe-4S dicluster domain-containing protein [Dehalococcoidales bacterium]|nr:4Fe-4S dicluster domain-containing protein [Dehalococcoidales bacterium]MCL0091607.1 4Fe-4S dicluster domain-containing protein [Dehalococcoidales bacterium]